MSSALTNYSFETPYPDVLERERNNTVELRVSSGGSLVAPSSATFSLISPTGATTIAATAATITSSVATYTISSSYLPSTASLGEGWLERWVVTMSASDIRTVDREAAVARVRLYPACSLSDLTAEYPTLNAYKGSSISSYQGFLDAAWKDIIRRLGREGIFSYLVKSTSEFIEVHRNLALAKIFRWQLMSNPTAGNAAERLAKSHEEKYESSWKQATFRLDYDHDGRVDDPSSRRGAGTIVHLGGAPYATTRPYVRGRY